MKRNRSFFAAALITAYNDFGQGILGAFVVSFSLVHHTPLRSKENVCHSVIDDLRILPYLPIKISPDADLPKLHLVPYCNYIGFRLKRLHTKLTSMG